MKEPVEFPKCGTEHDPNKGPDLQAVLNNGPKGEGHSIPMPDAVAPMPLKDFEALEKPGGTIIGNVYFICAVSKAQVAITMRQEGTKIHMTTSHRGVAQHTPVIEMYSKLMNVLREEK